MRTLTVVLLFALPAAADYPTADKLMRLDENMTMAEVKALLGDPSHVESGSCGVSTGHPWPCRTWVYTGGGRLNVRFQRDAGVWRVNSWE